MYSCVIFEIVNMYLLTNISTNPVLILLDFSHTAWRILSMTIIHSCAAGREMPRIKNQSKHMHANSPGNRAYGQTAKYRKANTPLYQTIVDYRTSELVLLSFRILGCVHRMSTRNRVQGDKKGPNLADSW